MKCKEVWVKFINKNHNDQVIRAGDVDKCSHLLVEKVDGELQISYVRTDLGNPRFEKVINFNFDHVVEYYSDKLVHND